MAIMHNIFPMMNKTKAAKFMKIIEEVIQNKSENSILKMNMNPMRVGLMLYRLVNEVQNEFGYSQNST
jgi:hypothetical protein